MPTPLTKLVAWLRSLFGHHYQLMEPYQGEAGRATIQKIQSQVEALRTGDLVEVTLLPEFCTNMLAQNQDRFDEEDLTTRKIAGVVFLSVYRQELRCNVLELLTAKRRVEGDSSGVVKITYSITGDELEAVRKLK